MGLVQYESSDEDEEVQSPVASPQPAKLQAQNPEPKTQNVPEPAPTTSAVPAALQQQTAPPPNPPPTEPLGPVLGPALGPSRPPASSPIEDDAADPNQEIDLSFLDSTQPTAGPDEPPRSPYTKTRTLLHNLTLPSVPNMDIPPSPPGTPPPGLDALTAKFDKFLELKRTNGIHFNQRLAASAGMKNPAVMDKLVKFVGVETDFPAPDAEGGAGDGRAAEQYATVLSAEVWDPGCFPGWAYRGPLRKAQERVNKERERGRGEPVEFVPATGGGAAGSAAGSRAGTPGAGKRKGRWDA